MHVAYFTERPYRGVPEDVIIRNKAYFAVPNSYFDHVRGAEDYNYYLDEYVRGAIQNGASGFLLKDVTAERLFDAVRVIAAGDALLSPGVTRRLISEFTRLKPPPDAPPAAALAGLTPRETQVLRLVAAGLSNPEIAAQLVVTEETVKTHVSRMLSKLGLRDRTQAVVTAYETGLVVPHSRNPG